MEPGQLGMDAQMLEYVDSVVLCGGFEAGSTVECICGCGRAQRIVFNTRQVLSGGWRQLDILEIWHLI
jgi:phosphoribosylformylglycinamidine (FGAM) synthase-like amidotransferase family enzyme